MTVSVRMYVLTIAVCTNIHMSIILWWTTSVQGSEDLHYGNSSYLN